MSAVPVSLAHPDVEPVVLDPGEVGALLGALRLDALRSHSSAGEAVDEIDTRRIARRAKEAERLRHAVARGCGPVGTTAELCLVDVDRRAIVEVLERVDGWITAGHPWGTLYAERHAVEPAELGRRLLATTGR